MVVILTPIVLMVVGIPGNISNPGKLQGGMIFIFIYTNGSILFFLNLVYIPGYIYIHLVGNICYIWPQAAKNHGFPIVLCMVMSVLGVPASAQLGCKKHSVYCGAWQDMCEEMKFIYVYGRNSSPVMPCTTSKSTLHLHG